jgi:hypothetical protein
VTFSIAGKQYVAVTTTIAPDIHSPATGNALYVFALPDKKTQYCPMLVAADFMPAFKYHQRILLAVLERGHKRRVAQRKFGKRLPSSDEEGWREAPGWLIKTMIFLNEPPRRFYSSRPSAAPIAAPRLNQGGELL